MQPVCSKILLITNTRLPLEVYYKDMKNQLDYREGYTPSLKDPEEEFVAGRGWSYGAEFLVNKQKGSLTGWIVTPCHGPGENSRSLMAGKFPTRYDRHHDLSVVANYERNRQMEVWGCVRIWHGQCRYFYLNVFTLSTALIYPGNTASWTSTAWKPITGWIFRLPIHLFQKETKAFQLLGIQCVQCVQPAESLLHLLRPGRQSHPPAIWKCWPNRFLYSPLSLRWTWNF